MVNFPPELFGRLENYVYRLIDPATGSTFYVGRGVKNRCFSHVDAARRRIAALETEGDLLTAEDGKFSVIKSILNRNEDAVSSYIDMV
mgnify:CR=1 FL=1